MAKLEMLKFEAVALQNKSKIIVEQLQKLGIVEIEKIKDDRLLEAATADAVSIYDKNIDNISNALDILSQYGVKSSLSMLSGRKELTDEEYELNCHNVTKIVGIANNIVSLKKEIADFKAEIVAFKTSVDSLSVWKKLDISMLQKSTENTTVLIGTFPRMYTYETLTLQLAQLLPDVKEYECEIVYSSKEITSTVLVCHKSVEKEFVTQIRLLGFVQPQELSNKPVNERIQELSDKIQQLEKRIADNDEKIKGFAKSVCDLEFAHDYFVVKRDEYENVSKIKFSGKTVVLSGYVPKTNAEKLKQTVEKNEGAVVLTQPKEDDDVPVVLTNGPFAQPVESITEMYALPGKKDIDPSAVMAFFYYLLFGMMLSDAGYGVIMTLGTAFILKKTNVEGNMRRMMKMFFYCGISTTIWGALFGSWFGDIIGVVCTNFLGYEKAPSVALWFEPINDPIKLLMFSFVVGILHLFLGLCAFAYIQWKDGNRVSAIFDTLPVMLMVLGAAPLAGSILMPTIPKVVLDVAKYVAIAGVVLIVLTNSRTSKNIFARLGGGLYGLYNMASGYLSDILSYSRLLALGLATGSIASVVNMMGAMPQNLVLKGVLLTVVFVVGHTLNMAINVLGAYVHTNRLQFVELFSKFYEGGGCAFEPLKFDTKYFKLK